MARASVQSAREDWWLLCHPYENGSVRSARQALLEPFEWTADGWPLARGEDASKPMTKPVPTATVEAHGQPYRTFSGKIYWVHTWRSIGELSRSQKLATRLKLGE